MPNNKKPISLINNIVPSTADNKKFNDHNNFKTSPGRLNKPELKQRIHLSPQSSCGSSTGSAFSSYCTSSCNTSTCSKRIDRPSSSGECSITDSTISSGSSSVLSCESSDCQHVNHSKCSSNSCLSRGSNGSYSSLSQSSSVCSSRLSDDITSKSSTIDKRFTRSSLSNSDTNGSIQESLTSINSMSESLNNSNSTSKTSSTVVTAKITRSTANSLRTDSIHPLQIINDGNIRVSPEETNIEKTKCMWKKCTYLGNSTEIDNSFIDHIKSKHIYSQKGLRRFRCLWEGCTVYQKPSVHFNWLERHVIDHIDKNPYMCIFNGCKRKFRTEEMREKHCQSHINSTENTPVMPHHASNSSPIKTKKHELLNTAKLALIENIKNKNNTNQLKSAKPLPNYSLILKNLTKKRKTQALMTKKFKKAQFKDFIDAFSVEVIDNKLRALNYQNGKCTFKAEILGSQMNETTNTEMFLVKWNPPNILENEWVEINHLRATKEVSVIDLPKKGNSSNPMYRRHRFRLNKRK